MRCLVYFFNGNFAPSDVIFNDFQIYDILPHAEKTDDIQEANVVVGTGKKFLNFIKGANVHNKCVILYKPHTECDIRLSYKNIMQFTKALANRFLLSFVGGMHSLQFSNVDLIVCDSRRLCRHFTQFKPAHYLPLRFFPLAKAVNMAPQEDLFPFGVVFGEATHFVELLPILKSLDKILDFKINLNAYIYGPLCLELNNLGLNNIRIAQHTFKFDYKYMLKETDGALFSVCCLRKSSVDYSKYRPLRSSHQPNEVSVTEKFSTNSGRCHLSASLGIPFITNPTEDVLRDFPWLLHLQIFENAYDLKNSIQWMIDPANNQKIKSIMMKNCLNDQYNISCMELRNKIFNILQKEHLQ